MHCSHAFLAWIADHAGFAGATLVSAQHSVYRGNGETDVLVVINTPEGRAALMIEDKIGDIRPFILNGLFRVIVGTQARLAAGLTGSKSASKCLPNRNTRLANEYDEEQNEYEACHMRFLQDLILV
jgi:hypothetical protein